jgi:hypothetical protein
MVKGGNFARSAITDRRSHLLTRRLGAPSFESLAGVPTGLIRIESFSARKPMSGSLLETSRC